MLDMGWAEVLVIAVVALLAVGPEKLPEVAQGLARLIRQTRRIVSEFREAIHLEEFDAQIRQSSRMEEPSHAPGVDRDLRTDVVEREAIDLGPEQDSPAAVEPALTSSPSVAAVAGEGAPPAAVAGQMEQQSAVNHEHPR
ncbi:MAG: Sec-independent protein translocase protein TatB [Magnetococcus sp. YQC-3]